MSPTTNTWITLTGSTRTIKIVTTNVGLHGTSVLFTVTSTLNDSILTSNSGYTFTITLEDPCRSATLNTPSVANMSVVDGSSATQTYTDVSDSHYTNYGNLNFCGGRTFTIETTAGAAVAWCTVALTSGSMYTITAAPRSTATELQTTHNLRVKIVSNTYSSYITTVYATFNVVVSNPACDCTLQPWDNGTGITSTAPVASTTSVILPLPTVSSNAYTSSPAMRSCSAG